MRIVAYVPDLMDKSRFNSVDATKWFVVRPEELSEATPDDIVIADLSRAGSLDALAGAAQAMRRIGFISHEDRETIARAKELGIEAIPRSRFFSRIVHILAPE